MERLSNCQSNFDMPKDGFLERGESGNTDFLKRGIGLVILFLFFLVGSALAQVAPVKFPQGGFNIDGNLVSGEINPLKVGNPQTGDWFRGDGAPDDSFVFFDDGTAVRIAQTFKFFDEQNSSSDNIFKGGLKYNDDPNNWTWINREASDKLDVNNVFVHLGTEDDLTNSQWLFVAADRFGTNGASYIDFEFLQDETFSKNEDGTFSSNPATGGRTVGDILMTVDYTGGGSVPVILFSRWQNVGVDTWDYVLIDPAKYEDIEFGATNATIVDAPYGAFGTFEYQPFQFVEAAIDLGAAFDAISPDPCESLTIRRVFIKTKSSPSKTADLEDFIEPIAVKLLLGEQEISYDTNDLCGLEANVIFTNPRIFETIGFSVDVPYDPVTETGLTIDPSTGTINLEKTSSGTYTITYKYYKVDGGLCPDQTTFDITIPGDAPEPEVLNTEFCSGSGIQFYDVTAGEGYTILYYESETSPVPFEGVPSVDTDVVAPGTYSVWVSQIKDGECESGRVEVSIKVQTCSISLEKTGTIDMTIVAPDDRVDEGDLVNYKFTVKNTGTVTLTNVTVADQLPGLGEITPTSLANLTPGATAEFTATYTVTQADLDLGSIFNTATVTGTPPVGNDVTDTDTETIAVGQKPLIEITKTADIDPYGLGDIITYTFTVKNTGNVTLTNITVTDPLSGLSAVSPTSLASLAPGATAEFTATYTTTQTDMDAGSISNTATVVATPPTGPNVTDTDNEIITANQDPLISILKTASQSSYDEAGDVITYSFEVTNIGNVTLTGVSVTDPLPGLSAITPAPVTLAPTESQIFTATYTITLADMDKGSVNNTATVTGTPPTGSNVTDTDSE
ncbi:MAG: DUF11 domain-containing protein, partial [Algoriphagus sp.]|nr:DUF11 domain-containing protein [Algoriphagus sp.]